MARLLLGAGVIRLDARNKTPLHRQIYEGIRESILAGNIKRGIALPASRSLAKQLSVSRMTVVNAYDQLLAEGYLQSRAGSGTFVNEELPDDRKLTRFFHGIEKRAEPASTIRLSSQGVRLANQEEIARPAHTGRTSLFSLGIPALDEFPLDTWIKISRNRERALSASDLTYHQPSGWQPLREFICEYTKTFRGVRCDPEQVFITAGTQQAIDLSARLLVDRGESVLFEDPGYWRARAAFRANGAKIIPLPVDENGASVNACPASAKKAKLIYVTPSHQFPMGMTMSIDRRIELLEWAQKNDATILEDDYDSVYSYSQPPIPSLQGLDSHGRTIYLGSLSKLMFPALGIGYAIVPKGLVPAYESAFQIIGRPPSLHSQMVVHDFIRDGHLERHIRRMRRIHEQRHSALVVAIEKYLPEKLKLVGADAGLHRTAMILTDGRDVDLAQRFRELGIHLQPISIDSITATPDHNGFAFGFGCAPPNQITAGIRKIAAAWMA